MYFNIQRLTTGETRQTWNKIITDAHQQASTNHNQRLDHVRQPHTELQVIKSTVRNQCKPVNNTTTTTYPVLARPNASQPYPPAISVKPNLFSLFT